MDAKIEELNYCARQLYPEYPGVFDLPSWEIGTKLCRPKNPDCINCYLNDVCPKII
jgi:endonuclease III